VSFTSAVYAPATNNASKEFGVGPVVGALGTALYVLGFAFGPVIWAPLSERKGRKWPLTISMLLGGIFTIASASAKDFQTLVICRFFAGMCAASQLTVVPGVLTDIFDNTYRGMAISVYALTVFVGPFTAPFTGGFIVSSSLGWRWTLYLSAILSFVNGGISFFFLQETYAPCILVKKAAVIRRQTKNWAIHAQYETNEVDPRQLLTKYFTRPLRMLVTEPIIFFVSLYMSFIYGLVYCLLEAYPYVFEDVYGFAPGVSGLPFIGLTIGQVLALAFILSQHSAYVKRLAKNDNVPVPEWRLIPTLFGAPIFTIGIFW
jgi:DHA1 family multidrug resistance protein-like MFS transporter